MNIKYILVALAITIFSINTVLAEEIQFGTHPTITDDEGWTRGMYMYTSTHKSEIKVDGDWITYEQYIFQNGQELDPSIWQFVAKGNFEVRINGAVQSKKSEGIFYVKK